MSEQGQHPYDAFLSYAKADSSWVEDQLVPRLEKEGLKVSSDQVYIPGEPILEETARAILQSRKTLLILSPAYFESGVAEFESYLAQTLDPAARKRGLIPVVRSPCEIPLRIKPLVSVDLSADDERQWRRLLDALDPKQPATLNALQRLAVAVAEPTASQAAPGWHRAGSVWLALGLLCVVLLVGLVTLLLSDWPVLGGAVSAMVGALGSMLGWLGLREDKDFGQRLSHFLGGARVAQASTAGMLVVCVTLWGTAGWTKLVDVVCGPLGCKPAGVQRVAFGEFRNLTPQTAVGDQDWAAGTRSALIQKLTLLEDSLEVINVASDQTSDKTKHDLDYWIEGEFQFLDRAELRCILTGPGGAYESPDVRVGGESAGSAANILTLQNALALALLERLSVDVDPAVADKIANTPTGNTEALALNNEGVALLISQDTAGAEAKFRAALALDPEYSVAYANLAYALAARGDYDGAITSYQEAIELLPKYAVFHYSLGHLYALLGDTDQALLSLQAAIRLDPGYVQAHNELGNVYIALEQWPEARRALERGLDLDITFAPLHKNLARVALAQGRPDEAIVSLQTALQWYQDKPLEATYLLAVAYGAADQGSEACRQLAAYGVLDPNQIGEWALDAQQLQDQLNCP